jgi:hypothetical protein
VRQPAGNLNEDGIALLRARIDHADLVLVNVVADDGPGRLTVRALVQIGRKGMNQELGLKVAVDAGVVRQSLGNRPDAVEATEELILGGRGVTVTLNASSVGAERELFSTVDDVDSFEAGTVWVGRGKLHCDGVIEHNMCRLELLDRLGK